MLAPSQIIGGGGAGPPLPTPMISYIPWTCGVYKEVCLVLNLSKACCFFLLIESNMAVFINSFVRSRRSIFSNPLLVDGLPGPHPIISLCHAVILSPSV